jgi:hypothetical protein
MCVTNHPGQTILKKIVLSIDTQIRDCSLCEQGSQATDCSLCEQGSRRKATDSSSHVSFDSTTDHVELLESIIQHELESLAEHDYTVLGHFLGTIPQNSQGGSIEPDNACYYNKIFVEMYNYYVSLDVHYDNFVQCQTVRHQQTDCSRSEQGSRKATDCSRSEQGSHKATDR